MTLRLLSTVIVHLKKSSIYSCAGVRWWSSKLVKSKDAGVYQVSDSFKDRFRILLRIKSMTESKGPFDLGDRVRGMKSLDQCAFDLDVAVPGIKVPMTAVGAVSGRFKNLLLKVPKVKPIAELSKSDPERETHKLFLFNPVLLKSKDDFREDNREFLTAQGVCLDSFKKYDLTLTYSNWTYDEILNAILPENDEGVGGFSMCGHIAHLNLRDHLLDYKYIIGQVILDKLPAVKTVVNKTHTIDNTYRNFKMEVLAGEPNFITTAREHGFMYKLDFSKVYWNSRLGTEHHRIVEVLRADDTVYDVFAGVGPFAIPAGKKGCRAFANDLNPESYHWLQQNISLNKVTGKVKGFNLDGREFIRTVLRDDLISRLNDGLTGCHFHVVMNLPALAIDFLDAFIGLLSSSVIHDVNSEFGLIVHCYCFSQAEDVIADASQRAAAALRIAHFEELPDRNVRIVRNVAPNKEMLCIRFRLPLSFLVKGTLESAEHTSLERCLEPEKKRLCLDS